MDNSEGKVRQLEGTVSALQSTNGGEARKLKAENEELYEKLAFMEEELQESKGELEQERERRRAEEVEEPRGVANENYSVQMKSKECDYKQIVDGVRGENLVQDDDIIREDKKEEENNNLGDKPHLPIPTTEQSIENQSDTNTRNEQEKHTIRRLEEQLKQTTEQLAVTQRQLSQTQAELNTAKQNRITDNATIPARTLPAEKQHSSSKNDECCIIS